MRSPDFSSTQVAAAPERSGTRGRGNRFRPEVQGLRAVAVLLVLVYHLDPELLPGGYVGVDVFFVISGFLITSLLLREVREHGRVSLAGFYVRRVRRLLPAATVVLLTTGAVSLVLLPVTRLADTAWQLLEHMRIAQWDIVEFSRNPEHVSPDFPDGYWPPADAPPNQRSWAQSVARFREDLKAMRKLVSDPATDLMAPIPHGDGQTVLREALLVADHNAYHLGQLVLLLRLLKQWPE